MHDFLTSTGFRLNEYGRAQIAALMVGLASAAACGCEPATPSAVPQVARPVETSAVADSQPANTASGTAAGVAIPDVGLAAQARELERLLLQVMSPDRASEPASRKRLADEMLTVVQIALRGQQLRTVLQAESTGREIGYFLARLESIRNEVEYPEAPPEPRNDRWTRLFSGSEVILDDFESYPLQPFGAAPAPRPKTEWGEVPNVMGDDRSNYCLLVLRKHEPELAARFERGMYPEVADVLLREMHTFNGARMVKELICAVPPIDQVPAVADRGKACAAFLREFIVEHIPAYRAQKALEQDMEIRMPLFEELHAKVLGRTMQELVDDRLDSTDADPLLVWRDLFREHHPEQVPQCTTFLLQLTMPIIESNQNGAQSRLRNLADAEREFHDTDADRNGMLDYWTGDVSGLRRLLVEGKPLEMIDASFAELDAKPLADAPWLAKHELNVSTRKPGYLLAAVRLDAAGLPLAQKSDNAPLAARNPDHFAFCAYPRTYGRTGRQTYLVTEDGRIRFKNTQGAPIERLPKDFEADDWTIVEGSEGDSQTSTAPANIKVADSREFVELYGKSTAELVRLLKHPDHNVVVDAILKLEKDPQALHTALPRLIEALKFPNLSVRLFAAMALGMLGPHAAEAAPALTAALSSENIPPGIEHDFRTDEYLASVATAIGKIGVGDAATAANLARLCVSEIPEVRMSAAWAWVRLSKQKSKQQFPGDRARLLDDLCAALEAGANGTDDELEHAAEIAASLATPDDQIGDQLTSALEHASSEWNRHAAARYLCDALAIVRGKPAVMEFLAALLNDAPPPSEQSGTISPKLACVLLLVSEHPAADESLIGELVAALADVPPTSESFAEPYFAEAFAAIGKPAVPALIRVVDAAVPNGRQSAHSARMALTCLARMGKDAGEAGPVAGYALTNQFLVLHSAEVLRILDDPVTLDALRSKLSTIKDEKKFDYEEHWAVTAEAVFRLSGNFEEVRPSFEELATLSRGREQTIESLRRIGPPAVALAPVLRQAVAGGGPLMKEADDEYALLLRTAAGRALLSIADDRETALRTAMEALAPEHDELKRIRREALRTVVELGPEAIPALPHVARNLSEADSLSDDYVEQLFAALTAIGPAANETLDKFCNENPDRSPALIQRAEQARRKIYVLAVTRLGGR